MSRDASPPVFARTITDLQRPITTCTAIAYFTMAGQDLLKRLPPEIRLQIYQLLLITPAPIIITYTGEDTFLGDESPGDCKDASGNTRIWDDRTLSILSTCRLYRLEAFPVLLSENQLAHVTPWRPFGNAEFTRSQLKVPREYLHHIKYIAVISQEDIEEIEDDVQVVVTAMIFLIVLLELKTRLDQLVICLDSSKIEESDIGHVHSGLLHRNCHGASSFIPLAVKYFASNLVKRVYIGCHTRRAPLEELQSYAGPAWQLEKHIHDIFEEFGVRSNSRGLFAVFQSWTNWHIRPPTRAFDLRFQKFTSEEGLLSTDVSEAVAKNAGMKSGLWYGNVFVLDGDDFLSWPDLFNIRLKELEAGPRRFWYNLSHPIEGYYNFEVELSPWEWDKLKGVERWWTFWWAAHQPGQRRITDYFHAEGNLKGRE